MSAVGIAEIPVTAQYFYDSTFEYANCWGPIQWVDLVSTGITVSRCRFLGICNLGYSEAQKVIQDWNAYKLQANFQP